MDYSLYQAINDLSGAALPDAVLEALARYLPIAIVAVVAFVFVFPAGPNRLRDRRGAVTGTIAAALALLINQPIAHAVDRLRPYAAHPAHAHLLIERSHDPSFPSDHATGAFALAAGVWFYNRKAGALLAGLAVLLSFSRVYVGTHYPGDVIGGALIGIGVALTLWGTRLRSLIERTSDMFSDFWDRIRFGAKRFERRYPTSVLLTGTGVTLLVLSELVDRIEHGLSTVMTIILVDAVLWALALGWIGMRRIRPWSQDSMLAGWLREWILPTLAMFGAALILIAVYTEHVSTGVGTDAWLAMIGATLVVIAQIIGRAAPHRRDYRR
jgi:membrane-associated phospholipid phosphatase